MYICINWLRAGRIARVVEDVLVVVERGREQSRRLEQQQQQQFVHIDSNLCIFTA